MDYPKSVEEILNEKEHPAVAADQEGILTHINDAFTRSYGWSKEDLLGKSITSIMPPHFRNAHHIGFSRFLATEKATLAGKPLPLAVLFKDGTVKDAEHFILAEKVDGKWRFAATVTLR